MIWSLAWRNVWRNKIRSIIVMSAVSIGLFAGIFSTGFYKGMSDMRLKSAIKTEVSHIQIHNKDYKINNDIWMVMQNSTALLDTLTKMNDIEGYSRRLISECMLSSAHGNVGVRLIGVEPVKERKVTDIAEKILSGKYLDNKPRRVPGINIGKKLADKLNLNLNSKLQVQMVDMHGNISTKLYKVMGIFSTSNTSYDENTAFILFDEMKKHLGLNSDEAHEIAIYLKPNTDFFKTAEKLKTIFPNLEILTWRQINKELAMITDSMDQYMYIFVLIIMLALCFGIINTMLMVVLERTKELGMLMAVGMNKLRVFMMIVLESVFLSFLGGFVGIAIGYAVIKYYETTPMVIGLFKGFEHYGYSSTVYTNLPFRSIITISFLVILLGVISALYPARRATKLDPADAIRTD